EYASYSVVDSNAPMPVVGAVAAPARRRPAVRMLRQHPTTTRATEPSGGSNHDGDRGSGNSSSRIRRSALGPAGIRDRLHGDGGQSPAGLDALRRSHRSKVSLGPLRSEERRVG